MCVQLWSMLPDGFRVIVVILTLSHGTCDFQLLHISSILVFVCLFNSGLPSRCAFCFSGEVFFVSYLLWLGFPQPPCKFPVRKPASSLEEELSQATDYLVCGDLTDHLAGRTLRSLMTARPVFITISLICDPRPKLLSYSYPFLKIGTLKIACPTHTYVIGNRDRLSDGATHSFLWQSSFSSTRLLSQCWHEPYVRRDEKQRWQRIHQ